MTDPREHRWPGGRRLRTQRRGRGAPTASHGGGGDPGTARTRDQWLQALGLPAESAVLNDEPQPHAATAFGLFTVKPAPMSVST